APKPDATANGPDTASHPSDKLQTPSSHCLAAADLAHTHTAGPRSLFRAHGPAPFRIHPSFPSPLAPVTSSPNFQSALRSESTYPATSALVPVRSCCPGTNSLLRRTQPR